MTTMSQARDEISTLINNAWKNAAYKGVALEMRWTGAGKPSLPPTDIPWGRTTISHEMGDQKTIGSVGSRRFERRGIIQIQIFTPLTDSSRLSLSEGYATLVRDSLEGHTTPSGIWLRRISVQEIGVDLDSGAWWQTNVSGFFQYEEIK